MSQVIKIKVRDIRELMEDRNLETATQPKTMRTRQQSVECKKKKSTSSVRDTGNPIPESSIHQASPPPTRQRRSENTTKIINYYGSEEESDESDDNNLDKNKKQRSVECKRKKSASSVRDTGDPIPASSIHQASPPRQRRSENTTKIINYYGSEEESDESDDNNLDKNKKQRSVECKRKKSASSVRDTGDPIPASSIHQASPPPTRQRRSENTTKIINYYGSEEESDESDDNNLDKNKKQRSVECKRKKSASSVRHTGDPIPASSIHQVSPPTRQRRSENTTKIINYGSEEESDESGDDNLDKNKKQRSVECKRRKSALSRKPASPIHQASPPPPTRQRRSADTNEFINYGSEEDSDESDAEEAMVFPGIPRVLRSIMETPLDLDEDAADDTALVAAFKPVQDPTLGDVDPKATEQPWRWDEFDWREFPDSPILLKLRRETFSESNVGPTTPHDDPYDIFVDIWDHQIMKHIVSETNKYAQMVAAQMFENNTLKPTSRITRWCDTTVDELYVFFGIILAMGIVVKTRLEEYWASTTDIFYTPGFGAHMSLDRFMLLSKCLHFSDNNDICAAEWDYSVASLFKIQPILSHLNKKFQELYTPTQNIVLDETLLAWKGCVKESQFIPNKAGRRGIKTYELCESQTGYLWRFEVHVHKKTPSQQIEDSLEESTSSIVLRLTKGLENKGYTLWMDNFYNSPCLARRLKSLGFDCVGTLRTDRKFVPQELHLLTKLNMRPGQITGLTSGDVDVMIWRHNNRVAMISTYHGNGQHTVRGSTKPNLILDYNINMGGIDKKDQILAMYPVERKQTKVWYKKLFKRLLNISVLNSYVIHHHSSSLSHRNFRIKLIKSLLSKHLSTPSAIPPSPVESKHIDVTHRLAEYPMRNHQRMRRTCKACRRQVRTFCVGCNKTVCMDPCFVTIHS